MPLNRISLDRQAEIDTLIQQIQLDTGMSYPENSLKDIIRASIPGVIVNEYDFDGKSNIKGAIFRKSNKYSHPIITVQSKQSPASKTFTLAHEFGHYVLDHNPVENYLIDDRPFDGTSQMQDEGEANFFAQSLLMPRDLFIKLDGFANDKQLAERFGVSEAAVKVRRKWLEQNGY